MCRLTLVLVLSLSSSLACATDFVRPRPLTEYADILLAQELDAAMTALNDRMSKCLGSGAGDAAECYCRYPGEAGSAGDAYRKIMEARPKWKGRVLFWKDMQSLASRSLIMPAVESLLQARPQSCANPHRQQP